MADIAVVTKAVHEVLSANSTAMNIPAMILKVGVVLGTGVTYGEIQRALYFSQRRGEVQSTREDDFYWSMVETNDD